MKRGAATIASLTDYLSGSMPTLNRAQSAIDDALELASIIVAEADGKTKAVELHGGHDRAVAIARGLLANHAGLTSYITDSALDDDDKPTRAGLVRAISGIYDRH